MERKITLAIPHYNNSHYIMETISASLTDERISEIIICDDKSDDIEILEHIVSSLNNPKIKLYKNPTNLGVYHNKIETVKKSSNRWALLIDSDNVISREFIDRIYEIDTWNTNTIYAPSYAYTFPQGPSQLLNFENFANAYITPEIYINNALTNENFMCLINNCNYFIPTTEFVESMPYNDYKRDTIDSMDGAVLFTDWLCNNKVFVVKNMIYKHRLHSNSTYMRFYKKCDEGPIRKYLFDKLSKSMTK